MKFDLENVPMLGASIKKSKLEAKALQLKKDFLNTLNIQQLKEIIKERGLSTTKMDAQAIELDNPNPIVALSFEELVNAIAWQVTGKVLITYCEKNKVECKNFKTAFNNLTNAIGAIK